MKRLLIVAIYALSISCATVNAEPPKPLAVEHNLTCNDMEGYEYYCYSDAECQEYLNGYAAILKHRFVDQQFGWFIKNRKKQVIHVNLFADHTGLKLIGRMEAEVKDNRIFVKYWGIICNLELNEVDSFYKEGFSNAKLK